mmetsp:Transcript_105574/g.207077  ORF Transcript_105574/g.207077 Transcript_105574/m.207077 type:complete len:105 (-) Transcript_105574:12-326(-)
MGEQQDCGISGRRGDATTRLHCGEAERALQSGRSTGGAQCGDGCRRSAPFRAEVMAHAGLLQCQEPVTPLKTAEQKKHERRMSGDEQEDYSTHEKLSNGLSLCV